MWLHEGVRTLCIHTRCQLRTRGLGGCSILGDGGDALGRQGGWVGAGRVGGWGGGGVTGADPGFRRGVSYRNLG